MKNLYIKSCFLCIVLYMVVAALPAISAESLQNYTNQEFRFGFQYPASWSVSPSLTSNSRAKVVSPTNTPHAECAVIIQRYPQTSAISQSDIDGLFAEPPSPSELKNALSQGFNDVEIVAVSAGALHFHPAQMARIRYSIGQQSGLAFVSGRMVVTATPGFTWTISCGGQGNTPVEAEKNFQFWQSEINRIVSSFQFR